MTSTFTRCTGALSLLALTLVPLTLAAKAQSADAKSSGPDCSKLTTRSERDDCATANAQVYTIDLHNVTSQNEAEEIMVAVRNTFDPAIRIYLLADQNQIVVRTYPEEFARIEAIVHELDRPHRTYRLTYTLTELDGSKTISTEHYSMVMVAGQETSMKEGDKVPIATGTYANGVAATSPASEVQTQFTYLDVGMNFDATIQPLGNGVSLKSKVEQSSLGQPVTITGVTEPVVRQSVLRSDAQLTLDKPVMLGTIDVPNTTHHIDIAVVIEQVK
jgi:type II secretory pathway component GspD/PulD (secretin)